MKQDRQYLAFDLGASSGRAILGRVKNGRLELEEIHRFKNYPYEKDGHYFWDFRALLGELETGLKKAAAAAPGLVSFSVDTWGVDYALFRGGELLHDRRRKRGWNTTRRRACRRASAGNRRVRQGGRRNEAHGRARRRISRRTAGPRSRARNGVFRAPSSA